MAYRRKDITLGKAFGAWLLIVGVPGATLVGLGYAAEFLFGWDPEIVALTVLPLLALGFLVFLTVNSISQEMSTWRLHRRMQREQTPYEDRGDALWPDKPMGDRPDRSDT